MNNQRQDQTRHVSVAFRTPSEKFQSVAVDGESGPPLDQFGQLVQRAEHQISDAAAPPALDVMMVPPAMPHLVPRLPFMEPHRLDQSEFLEHGQIPIHGDEIRRAMRLLQAFVHLRRGDRQGALPKNLQDRHPGLGELLAARFQTLKHRIAHSRSRQRIVASDLHLPRSAGVVNAVFLSGLTHLATAAEPVLRSAAVLIDTHTHLDDARYDTDREAVLTRAREAGVNALVTIGCDLATSRAAVVLAERYPFVYAAIGVHPHEVKHIGDGWYDELRRLAQHPKIVAYGEIGLDYHYNHSAPKEQRHRFREQIGLARELKLPLVIHTREAQADTIAILREERASEVGGVFHCFSGDAWLAKDALDLGFYLSFSGIITFQNATMLRDIAKTVPPDRLLIETDCPYLTPVPYRGKRNEPAYVALVAKTLAEVRTPSETAEDIGRITAENARRLFRIS